MFFNCFFQEGKLDLLSQYKDRFYISETQIIGELIKPAELAPIVRKFVNVISEDRTEIIEKTVEYSVQYETLSFFDCLCMAYAFLDGYYLITDDKALQNKCAIYKIEVKSSKDIEDEFLKK